MPRPTRAEPTESRTVTLPKRLWQIIDQSDWDTLRNKPRYGHLARFFERLVNQEKARLRGVASLGDDDA